MSKKYKVGYTAGVFDMFHIGHVNILKKAKEQCDYLIVAVSTDELVEEYKHKTAIIPFAERLEIVCSSQYVDEVVPQENRDKLEALKNLKFDVMFVGDDWKGSPLFNELEEEFAKRDVDIVYFPYTEGTSSTILREKLKMLVL